MQDQVTDRSTGLDLDGFAVFEAAIASDTIASLLAAVQSISRSRKSAGMRNLLSLCPEIRKFATSGAAGRLAREIVGESARPVRAILFDKTPDSNWYVTWHQDLSIPVTSKVDVEGFGAWSVKDGITHVQPPHTVLEQMISLRIHLDDCLGENGPIKFISGSHLNGILSQEEISRWRDEHTQVLCTARRGDVIAMRPLIVHGSSTAESPAHRRVLHIEYTGSDLPRGLDWAEA